MVFVEMQIGGVEFASPLETFPIPNGEEVSVQNDQTVAPQLLQAAIDMDGAEPQGIADLGLRERQFATVIVSKPERLHAH